jgi:hypothetical protein
MYLLETDPDVLSYHSQPLSIFYTFNHRQRCLIVVGSWLDLGSFVYPNHNLLRSPLGLPQASLFLTLNVAIPTKETTLHAIALCGLIWD